MARGRPLGNFQDDEKVTLRREKVRLNVQAHRQRQKERRHLEAVNEPCPPKFRWVSETKRSLLGKSYNRPRRPSPLPTCRESPSILPVSLLSEPNPEKQYTLALLGMFRTRFLPERVTLPQTHAAATEKRLTTPCALWIVKGYDLAAMQDSAVVTGIFRALGLAILAAEQQRVEIQALSLHTYHQTLSAISRKLKSITDGGSLHISDYLAIFLSCYATAMYEMNVSVSLPRMFDHVRGLGSVLVHRSLQSGSIPREWHDLTDEYRLLETVFCLTYREPSVLTGTNIGRYGRASTDANSKWDPEPPETSQIGGLVFIARHIPPVMAHIDCLKAPRSSFLPLLDGTREAIHSLLCILTQLEHWSVEFLRQSASTILESEAYTCGRGNLEFPGLEVASAWNFWLSFKAHALENYVSLLETTGSPQQGHDTFEHCDFGEDSSGAQSNASYKGITAARSELLATVQLLIRSMPYLLEADLGYIGKSFIAFPLETVRLVLRNELERGPCMLSTTTLQPMTDSTDERLHTISEGLASCAEIAEKAKDMRCALFSDHWPGSTAGR